MNRRRGSQVLRFHRGVSAGGWRRAARPQRRRLAIESLEQRQLLSAVPLAASTPKSVEVGSAVFRDGVLWGLEWHAGMYWLYDGYTGKDMVIHADGTQVAVADWDGFLAGNAYQGSRELSTVTASEGDRQDLVYEGLWQVSADYTSTVFTTPNTSWQSGDGSFRCDTLVQYAYGEVFGTNFDGWAGFQTPHAMYNSSNATSPPVTAPTVADVDFAGLPSSSIVVDFSELMSRGTLDPSSVSSISLSGSVHGDYALSSADVSFESDLIRPDLFDYADGTGHVAQSAGRVIIDPAGDFVDGEELTLTISTAAKDLAGNSMTSDYVVTLEVVAQRLDLIFCIDTTSSMWDDIDAVKVAATEIINEIAANIADYRIAVVDYRDFPVSPYGGEEDYPFHDVQSFTDDAGVANAAIQSLTLGWGDDWDESVYSALIHSVDATSLGGWRGQPVKKAIIVMGDAPPHDPEPFTGYTAADVIQAAIDADPVVYFPLIVGDDPDTEDAFTALATGTGGKAGSAADSSEVVDAILAIIEQIADSPFPEAGGPYSGGTGELVTFDASASYDPDGSIVLYEWDWDSDGVYDESSASPVIQHAWLGAFSGVVSLRVTDNDGLTGIDTALVEIGGAVNTEPTVELPDDAVVDEGTALDIGGSFVDPDDDTWSATVDYGDGSEPQALVLNGDKTFTLDHAYADNGTFTITVTVNDDQDGSGSDTLEVTVLNVAPIVDPIDAPDLVVPYQPFTCSAGFADPGTLDIHSATINWGDGSPTETAAVTEADGAGVATAQHIYTRLGNFKVTIVITDDDGGQSVVEKTIQVRRAGITTDPMNPDVQALFVGGGAGSDAVTVLQSRSLLAVSIPNLLYAQRFTSRFGGPVYVFAGPGNDVINLATVSSNAVVFAGAGSDRIFAGRGDDDVDGGDGNDVIFGMAGNDLLRGGNGADILFGGAGNDIVLGGDGYDYLHGDGGQDLLVGGGGSDWLFGDAGQDLLIGGRTVYDPPTQANNLALLAIMQEWSTVTKPIGLRINSLRTGGGLNGSATLQIGTTVLDDNRAYDMLLGGLESDWFLTLTGDFTLDRGWTDR